MKMWNIIKIVSYLLTFSMCFVNSNISKQDKHYWYNSAKRSIERRFHHSKITPSNAVKNVIMFVGDGMGMSTLTAARIFKAQKMGRLDDNTELIWESFPAVALTKTYNADAQIGESSACATALMSGAKANYETVGVDSTVSFDDCAGTYQGKIHSLATWAQQNGKSTGIVTNTRLTHATPAALYAHSPNRYWEDDSKVDISSRMKCKDIARQLLEDEPGINFKVMLGGGRRHFTSIATHDPEEPHKEGKRLDGRNLVEDWLRMNQRLGRNVSYVTNKEQLRNVHPNSTKQLLGLFSHSHMDFNVELNDSLDSDPSLTEMTMKALDFVQEEKKGYLLVVESGRIDHAHHYNNAFRAIDETLSLENAVSETLKRVNLKETLVIVTGDHSHVFVLGGYPSKRSNSVSGMDQSEIENNFFTSLLYANGPGGIKKSRKTRNRSQHKDLIQKSIIPTSWATHAGEDVPIYAIGPWAKEIFSGTIDQTYIPHAIAYVSCIGHFAENCKHHAPEKHISRQQQNFTEGKPVYSIPIGKYNEKLFHRYDPYSTLAQVNRKDDVYSVENNSGSINSFVFISKCLFCMCVHLFRSII